MNRKNILISLLVVVILGGLLFGIFYTFQNTDSDTTNEETTEETQEANNDSVDQSTLSAPIESQSNPIEDLVGSYSGQGALFSGAFQFPDTSFTLDQDNRFLLQANGLDLIVTQNQSLSINGQFPVTNVTAQGFAELQGDGSIAMNVDDFGITFLVADQPVDDATSQAILNGLESSFNVVLPEASVQEPLLIETQLTLAQDGSLDISNKSGTQDQIYVSFDGQKAE